MSTAPPGHPADGIEASETATLRSVPALRRAIADFDPTPATWLVGLLIIGALGTLFLSSFLWGSTWVSLALSIAVGALALLGFVLGMVTSRRVRPPRAMDMALAVAGAAVAQFLTREMGMQLLVAAAFTGLLIGIAALPGMPLDVMCSGSAYAGVFTGLVLPNVTLPPWAILIAALAAGALFSVIGPSVMPGVGARMGVSSFMGGSLVYFMADAVGAERPALIPPPSAHLPHWGAVPTAVAAALVTWILVERLDVPFVLASAGPALLVCAGTAWFLPLHAPVLGAAWLGGSFVGGSGSNRLPTAFWVAVGALVFGGLMLHFESPLNGHIGIIGATATIAVLATVGIEWVLHASGLGPVLARVGDRIAT